MRLEMGEIREFITHGLMLCFGSSIFGKKCLNFKIPIKNRDEAEKEVKGFPKAVYKKFKTKHDAIAFLILKSPYHEETNYRHSPPPINNANGKSHV